MSSKYLELTRKKLELTRLPHELAVAEESGVNYEYGNEIRKSEIEPLIDYWYVVSISFYLFGIKFRNLSIVPQNRLEQYSWRTQETHLNTIPQYRTTIILDALARPIRLHFIHIPSPDPTAIPLLLIPPFPFTNLSLQPLISAFNSTSSLSPIENASKNENDAENYKDMEKGLPGSQLRKSQNFHLIIPSIPGLGFSDPLSTSDTASYPLQTTAQLFDILMLRLGYQNYVVSTTSSSSPSLLSSETNRDVKDELRWDIPTHLALTLGRDHNKNCIAIHLFDPSLREPSFRREPWTWIKWSFAWFVRGGVFGYRTEDFEGKSNLELEDESNLKQIKPRSIGTNRNISPTTTSLGLGQTHTTILSYALCDSPIGMLAYTLSIIRNQPTFALSPPTKTTTSITATTTTDSAATIKGPVETDIEITTEIQISPAPTFSPKELIDITNLSWLPGPEAALRFRENALAEIADPAFGGRKLGSSKTMKEVVLGITNLQYQSTRQPAIWARHTFASLLSNNTKIVSGGKTGKDMGGLLCFQKEGALDVARAIRAFGNTFGEVFNNETDGPNQNEREDMGFIKEVEEEGVMV